jgi:hypothetical protein
MDKAASAVDIQHPLLSHFSYHISAFRSKKSKKTQWPECVNSVPFTTDMSLLGQSVVVFDSRFDCCSS